MRPVGLRGAVPRPILTAVALLALGLPLSAYIGPGAGFAFLSSFLVLFLTFFLALFSFLSWPFRLLWRLIRGQKAYKNSRVDQVVIVGPADSYRSSRL